MDVSDSLSNLFVGLGLPLFGTTAGAAMVFLMRGNLSRTVSRILTGFAAGVMVAASIWSLIIPAIESSGGMGRMAWVPAFVGFWVGIAFLLVLDSVIPHLHLGASKAEGPRSGLTRNSLMVLAVTLHNIPEGMAVGPPGGKPGSHRSRCLRSLAGHRNPELPRGSHHLDAAARRG